MSFVTKLGQDATKDQKLVLLRRKYFRNILEFNQVWQKEKKQTEIKVKKDEHNQFQKVVRKEFQALEIEKERLWRQKMNNQDILKHDYDHQIVEKDVRIRQEREKDKEFVRQQEVENDKVSQRRLLDLLKIYDRKAVKNSSQRRLKTDIDQYSGREGHFNLEKQGDHLDNIYKKQGPIRPFYLPLKQETPIQENPQTKKRLGREKEESGNKAVTFQLITPTENMKTSKISHLPKISQPTKSYLPFAGMRSGGHSRSLRILSRDVSG